MNCLPSEIYKSKDDAEIKNTIYLPIKRCSSVPGRLNLINSNYKLNNPKQSINGFYSIIIGKQVCFEGLFKNGRRYGPGIVTYLNSMCQNVGWWQDKHILRLCKPICPACMPKLFLTTPCDVNYLPNITYKDFNTLKSKMASIIGTSKSQTDFVGSIDWSLVDVENILKDKYYNVMIKECELKNERNQDAVDCFSCIACTKTMSELVKHTMEAFTEKFNTHTIYNFVYNSRSEFGKPAAYERACAEFLATCSTGDRDYFKRLINYYKLNPNVCDCYGNSGLLFATAKDKIEIIRELALCNADFNIVNDEGLTALSIVLLRFIALLRNVTNWNAAFTNVANDDSNLQNVNTACYNCDETRLIQVADLVFYYNNYPLPDLNERLQMTVEQIFNFYDLHWPSPGLQNFQGNYCNVQTKTNYVFDFSLKHSNRRDRKPNARLIDNETFLRLAVIFNTFVMLLQYGADPNLSQEVLPPLFLGLFTESADVIKMLLKFGVDSQTRLRTYHNCTILHALVSMRPGMHLVAMAEVLFTKKFDIDARTDGNHWIEERRWVAGNIKEIADIGKTALHVLAMRNDFQNNSMWMQKLAVILIENGASCSKRYLGHVPLTLAMMRGNIDLVRTLLNCGASPNEAIGNVMGSPMTIYLLFRYKNQLPPMKTCKTILRLLFVHGGDPLLKVYKYHNAFEFLKAKKSEFELLTVKWTSIQMVAKSLKFTRLQLKINDLLLVKARQRMMRHYESLMFMALFQAFRTGMSELQDHEFYLKLSRLTSFPNTLRFTRYLIYYQVLNVCDPTDCKVLHNLFAFVKKRGGHVNDKKKKELVEMVGKLTPLVPKKNVPEFDIDFDKYKVCFTCGLRKGKTLLACPSCGLVHFCSKKCEAYSRKNNLHWCKISFYQDELIQYKFCAEHTIHYEGVHDEVFNHIRNALIFLIDKHNKITNKQY